MRSLKSVDTLLVSKLLSQLLDAVTCLECCKYYVAPSRAPSCGHLLCHTCWKKRRSCPLCAASVDKKELKIDTSVPTLTDDVTELLNTFEQMFGVKIDELIMEGETTDKKSEVDRTKHVKDWLTSSDNHFSEPPYSNTQQSTKEILPAIELSTSKIQVHTEPVKKLNPIETVHIPIQQDDWDKIEVVPDSEDICQRNKENVAGPMDLEPFYIEDNEYTNVNPRRSLRKRDNKNLEINTSVKSDHSKEKPDTDHTSLDSDKKLGKAKQNWTNVKKMRKEFSKLNKINKNKLNVSIEMCKKTQNTVSKPSSNVNKPIPTEVNSEDVQIDDTTPNVGAAITKEMRIDNNLKETTTNNYAHSSESILQTIAIRDNDGSIHKDNELNAQNCIIKEKSPINLRSNKIVSHIENITKTQNVEKHNIFGNETVVNIPFILKSSCAKPGVVPEMNGEEKNLGECNGAPLNTANNPDDIHITIRIGDVVTNITINKKHNNVQLKVNTDRSIQTSVGGNVVSETDIREKVKERQEEKCVPVVNLINTKPDQLPTSKIVKPDQTMSNKKHTASAETATAQFEITESVEKELSKIMEINENDNNAAIKPSSEKKDESKKFSQASKNSNNSKKINKEVNENKILEDFDMEDIDIFQSGSIKDQNVQLLKNAQTSSEILVSHKTNKTQKTVDKRSREEIGFEDSQTKRTKLDINNKKEEPAAVAERTLEHDSSDYDELMGQVFANIDADIQMSQKSKKSQANKTIKNTEELKEKTEYVGDNKYSDNLFSTVGNVLEKGNTLLCEVETPADVQLCTPAHDDSDSSIVEGTPQKNSSSANTKSKTETSNVTIVSNIKLCAVKNKSDELQTKTSQPKPGPGIKPNELQEENIIDLSDTVRESIVKRARTGKGTLETPITINRFVDHIKHNSTPVARKSLNFVKNNEDDDDVTLCETNTSIVSKTTQEKEIMHDAFKNSPDKPVRKVLAAKNVLKQINETKFCIAGSCLTGKELTDLKVFCFKKKWKYVDKYTPELTHLVVAVDEENRAQRSVKYMCALASGKWIVSYKWIEKCIEANGPVNEAGDEALDTTGAPGPARARLAHRPLFTGLTFYCLPPFSVLDLDTLIGMLEAAGGKVVRDPKLVRVTENNPSLLLAEPENTQEDKFIYLAMELSVVPVNYEWALNSLGAGALQPLGALLLSPRALLPPATADWPRPLLDDDI